MERMIHLVKVDFGFIDSVLQKYDCDKTRVIAIMQEIQNEYKFLPKDALKYVAEKVGESEAELYGVATFYEKFLDDEKGKYIIKVCNGTACHVRKSDDVQEAIYAATGLTPEDHISSRRAVYHRARRMPRRMQSRSGVYCQRRCPCFDDPRKSTCTYSEVKGG